MATADKLKTSTFKYIESEVYELHNTLREMDLLKYELIHSTSSGEDENTVKGKNSAKYHEASVTETKATELHDNRRLRRMETVTQAILKVYDKLIPEKKQVMKLYYWDKPGQLTWEGVAKENHISRRTAIRWRRQFIYDIAKELGEK